MKSGPSVFVSVCRVLALVDAKLDPSDNPHTVAAKAAIPARFPRARMFMAWESFYKNTNARRDTLAAMTGQL